MALDSVSSIPTVTLRPGPRAVCWLGGQGEFHFGELFPRVGFIVTNAETDILRRKSGTFYFA
jgi:hypothetical protein